MVFARFVLEHMVSEIMVFEHIVFRNALFSQKDGRRRKQASAPQEMIAENSAGLLSIANVQQVIDGAEYVVSAGGVLHESVRQLSVFYAGIIGHDDLCIRTGIFERAGQLVTVRF